MFEQYKKKNDPNNSRFRDQEHVQENVLQCVEESLDRQKLQKLDTISTKINKTV